MSPGLPLEAAEAGSDDEAVERFIGDLRRKIRRKGPAPALTLPPDAEDEPSDEPEMDDAALGTALADVLGEAAFFEDSALC
jgi:hypothetical protein